MLIVVLGLNFILFEYIRILCDNGLIFHQTNCIERRSTAQYGGDLVMWCNVSNVCNMSAKNNSDSEYYGRDLVMWCNISNMLAKK